MSGSVSTSDFKTLNNSILHLDRMEGPGPNAAEHDLKHIFASAVQPSTASTATAAAGTEPIPATATTSYAISNTNVAEALKALVPIFNDNFIESSKPIKLEQLYFLPLEKVIEICYIGLLVSMLKKMPFNRKSYPAIQALMTTLNTNAWKTSNSQVGTPILTKHFLELAKILGLTNNKSWLTGFLKFSGALSTLTKQSNEQAFPCSHGDIHPAVMVFIAGIQHSYGEVVFKINQQIREKQLSVLEAISKDLSILNKVGSKNFGQKFFYKKNVPTEFSREPNKLSLKAQVAYTQDTEKFFCKLKDSFHRICYCSGIIMENLQKQCLLLTKSSKLDDFLLEKFTSLGMRFHLGYKKRIEKLLNDLINYENYNLIANGRGGYYSDNSKKFLKEIHAQHQYLWTLFTSDLLEKIRAIPQIESEMNSGSIEDQTMRSQRLSDAIGFYIDKCLWKKNKAWTDKTITSANFHKVNEDLESQFEDRYDVIALEIQLGDPRIEKVVVECCEEFFKRSFEINKKMGAQMGIHTSLFANVISKDHEDMLRDNSSSALKEFSSNQSPERLKQGMLALETTNAADVFFKTIRLFLQNASDCDDYDPENLKLLPAPSDIIQECLDSGTDLNLLAIAESLRKTLMTLLMSCSQTRNKVAQATLTVDWMESIDEQDIFELETEQVIQETEKDKKSKASNAKFEPQIVAKTVNKSIMKCVIPPYPSRSDRLLALFRYNLGSVYNLPTGLVPAAMVGQVTSLTKIAMHQQLLAEEGIQAVREMQSLTNDPETVKFLEKFLFVYEHLSIEQGFTVHDVEKFPDLERTHRLDIMSERLKLNTVVDVASRSIMGTCNIRYPHSYAAWEKAYDEKNAKENPIGIEDRIKKVVEVQSKTLEKCSTAATQVLQQFEHLWKQSEAQGSLQKETMSACLSKGHAAKLEVAAKQIQESKRALEKHISTLPMNTVDERKTIEALKNVFEHLNNLDKLITIAPKYAHERFLFIQAHMGTLSSQYLAENLGAYLSLTDGAELRNHNLLLYYLSHGLGTGLSAEEWETFIAINVLKGSEYLFNYFSKRSKKQVSPIMDHLSALYGASAQGRLVMETGTTVARTIGLAEMQSAHVEHLVKQIELCISLLSYHLK